MSELKKPAESEESIIDNSTELMEAGNSKENEVGFAGDEAQSESVAFRIKEKLDLEATARAADPEGVAGVYREIAERTAQIPQRQQEVAELQARLEELTRKQAELQDSEPALRDQLQRRQQKGLVKLKGFFHIKDGKVADITSQIESLPAQQKEVQDSIEEAEKTLASQSEDLKEMQDTDTPLAEYLEQFETPLSVEEKRELLDLEALTELTTDEYVALWRRLNPQFMAHVTRQGFRDHNAMIFHSTGLGKFHDGFTKMLEDDLQLRTPMEVRDGFYEINEQTVGGLLEKIVYPKADSAEKAKEELVKHFSSQVHRAGWPDKRAVHFAQLTVLDDYYGGEAGNEIFAVYPTDVLASQCHVANASSFTEFPDDEPHRKHNDVWVYPSAEKPSLPLDAGLIFIPKDQMVDPMTGSKYASEETLVDGRKAVEPVPDDELIAKFTAYAGSLTPNSPEIAELSKPEDDRLAMKANLAALGFNDEAIGRITNQLWAAYGKELKSLLDPEKRYFEMGHNLFNEPEQSAAAASGAFLEQSSKIFLESLHVHCKAPDNSIPSKEYWEKYFIEHPEQQPKHIVFYEGGDPSKAILDFLEKNGIAKQVSNGNEKYLLSHDDIKNDRTEPSYDDPHLGLGDSVVEVDGPNGEKGAVMWRGYDEMMSIADKLISEHYS